MINTILTSPYKSNIIDVVQFEKGVIIMNKRIDKKKQKRTLESAVTATATSSAPATATPVVEIKEGVKEVKVPGEVSAKNPTENATTQQTVSKPTDILHTAIALAFLQQFLHTAVFQLFRIKLHKILK